MRKRLDSFSSNRPGGKGGRESSKNWFDKLWPFVWISLGGIGVLVLLHAKDLLTLWK